MGGGGERGNKSAENYHKEKLTTKGDILLTPWCLLSLLLFLSLQEYGAEAELLYNYTTYKTMREHCILLQFSCTSTELILILHPHFHMKTLQVTVIYHYFLPYSELIVQIPYRLIMVQYIYLKALSRGPNNS